MFESSVADEVDDLGSALRLLACAKQICQGVSKLENYARAGVVAVRSGAKHNWMEYEHCRNALQQLPANAQVSLSEPYQAKADEIRKRAEFVVNMSVADDDHFTRPKQAETLLQKADQLYKKVLSDQINRDESVDLLGSKIQKSERLMSVKSLIGSYLVGTDVIINCTEDVVGHRGGRGFSGGGWRRFGGGWIGPGGQPVFAPEGDIVPIINAVEEEEEIAVVGEVESIIQETGLPGHPIMVGWDVIQETGLPGHPIMVGGGPRGGGGRGRGWGGRGWGRGRGWGWGGYPWGPPLDYGYTVVQEENPLADLALAEVIQQNNALQKKISEREEKDWDRAREPKKARVKSGVEKRASETPASSVSDDSSDDDVASVVGRGGHGGGGRGGRAQGYFRGGWFGGDYPPPFAYVGPYEDVDTAVIQTGEYSQLGQAEAEAALAGVVHQNEVLENWLESKAKVMGGSFEDFDSRTIEYTGKMRGG